MYTGPRIGIGGSESKEGNVATGTSVSDRFQLESPEERAFDEDWSKDLDWEQHMRYFSGTEIARLMGFPVSHAAHSGTTTSANDGTLAYEGHESSSQLKIDVPMRTFSFPESCSMKRQWKLLGNSLNVHVASCLAEIGLRSIMNDLAATTNSSPTTETTK